jgi:hypothetical protein
VLTSLIDALPSGLIDTRLRAATWTHVCTDGEMEVGAR